MINLSNNITRRKILKGGLILAAGLAFPVTGFCRTDLVLTGERAISLINTHTGEELRNLTYWAEGDFLPDALNRLNWVLRDHRSGDVHDIDPSLFDQVHAINTKLCQWGPVQIISGYRSAASNNKLRKTTSGVASHSLHMEGRALDIRVPDCDISHLRNVAKSLHAGGVGFYPKSQFVHIDTGRVRYW